MGNRGLTWGLLIGIAAALVVLLLPAATLESLVRDSGLAALLPAAQPPLGGTARFMLAALAFAIPTLIGALAGTRREETEERDMSDGDDAVLPASQQVTAHPGVASPGPAFNPSPDSGLESRLARIETMLAEMSSQPNADLNKALRSIQRALRKRLPDPAVLNAVRSLQGENGPEAVLARLEAVENRIGDQLTELNARLSALGGGTSEPLLPPVVRLPTRRPDGLASRRIGETVADIRRSIESLNA